MRNSPEEWGTRHEEVGTGELHTHHLVGEADTGELHTHHLVGEAGMRAGVEAGAAQGMGEPLSLTWLGKEEGRLPREEGTPTLCFSLSVCVYTRSSLSCFTPVLPASVVRWLSGLWV